MRYFKSFITLTGLKIESIIWFVTLTGLKFQSWLKSIFCVQNHFKMEPRNIMTMDILVFRNSPCKFNGSVIGCILLKAKTNLRLQHIYAQKERQYKKKLFIKAAFPSKIYIKLYCQISDQVMKLFSFVPYKECGHVMFT